MCFALHSQGNKYIYYQALRLEKLDVEIERSQFYRQEKPILQVNFLFIETYK